MPAPIGNVPPVTSRGRNGKPNLILILVVIGLLAFVIIIAMFFQSSASKDVTELFEQPSIEVADEEGLIEKGFPAVSVSDHARGAADPRIVWIEYGDFECPFCKRYAPHVEALLAAYPDDVQVVYRHFPLESHTNAFEKAVATECAAELGGEVAFWQYHDLLFERSNDNGLGISLTDLPVIASELGMDSNEFSLCLASGRYDSRIEGDIATGVAAGITGTPSTVIVAPDGAGTLLPGVVEIDQMIEIVDFLLNEYAPVQ